jgi:hypothetical protein
MPGFSIRSGTLEGLKWLAFICMAIDHANKFLPSLHLQSLYPVGRLAMPIFAFIFGYSLSHLKILKKECIHKLLIRLLLTALIASVPYIYLQKNFIVFEFWPLNIIFMFLLASIILYINTWRIKYKPIIQMLLFIIGGMFVEFYWAGLLIVIFSHYFAKKPTWQNLLPIIFSLVLLIDLNGNFYAFLFLPIIYLSQFIDIKIIRIKHIFYYLYPLHLFVISLFRVLSS